MSDIKDDLAAIKAALEAGPTFAEWEVLDDSRHIYSKTLVDDGEDSWLPLIAVTDDDETLIDFETNARYIAACNPVAIRALLDRLMAAEEEKERLREFERSAALTLPGVYYMDPPDGGDVSLLKQLQRMSIDAARYRLLRRKFAIISDGKGNAEFCPINLPRPTHIAPDASIELDAAIDAARRKE